MLKSYGRYRAALLLCSAAISLTPSPVEAVPPNDNCSGWIEAFDGDTPFSTNGATTDGVAEEPICTAGNYTNIDRDIWYRYTSTCTGWLNVNLCDDTFFDTKVAVYDGCVCPAPSPPIGCNDDFCSVLSFLSVPVVHGGCYTIRLGGYIGQFGSGTMNLSCTQEMLTGACCSPTGACLGTMLESDCAAANGIWHQAEACGPFACPVLPPDHDECDDCIPLSTGVPLHGSTLGATGTMTSCGTNDTNDVWHCWTADCTGQARVSTCGSAMDTILAVYDGCNGEQIGCNDDSCSTGSQVTFAAVAGNIYHIRLAGHNGATGDYEVLVEPCRNACCANSGNGCFMVTPQQCLNGGGEPLGPGTVCEGDADANGLDDACEPGFQVPSVSEWGLAILLLVGLTVGTVMFRKQPRF